MKPITGKLFISLIGVLVAAIFFALAILAGAHAAALAEKPQDELLLLALAIAGATISMINGFGRSTQKRKRREQRRARESQNEIAPRRSSLIRLGY